MLIGKWPDCHHLSINWLVKKRFAIAIKNLAREELRPPATDQKEIGNEINNMKKAIRPNPKTGSPKKLEAISVKIHKEIGDLSKIIVFPRLKADT